jgi:hypothetical protein
MGVVGIVVGRSAVFSSPCGVESLSALARLV